MRSLRKGWTLPAHLLGARGRERARTRRGTGPRSLGRRGHGVRTVSAPPRPAAEVRSVHGGEDPRRVRDGPLIRRGLPDAPVCAEQIGREHQGRIRGALIALHAQQCRRHAGILRVQSLALVLKAHSSGSMTVPFSCVGPVRSATSLQNTTSEFSQGFKF